MKAVQDYFLTGVLPKAGTVCQVDETLFGGPSETGKRGNDQDKALGRAAVSLGNKLFQRGRRL